jgi:tRNA G26 N,N-dimethylase Trm1
MWLDAIHDSEFADRVLKSIDGQKDSYNTWARMHGMLTLAKNVSNLLRI